MRDRSECRQDKERFGTVFCPEGTAGFSPGFQPREMSTHGDKAHMEATTPTSERRNRISEHPIVSPEQWIPLRKELLRKEKELTRLRDRLNAERRELPWVRVERNYFFEAPGGKVSLTDL